MNVISGQHLWYRFQHLGSFGRLPQTLVDQIRLTDRFIKLEWEWS